MRSVTSIHKPLIVAVCGDSGSGKSTLTDGMVQVFGQERVAHICLDDYHILDRASRMRVGITALHPDANNFALMTEQLARLARGETIIKPVYDHKVGVFRASEEVHPRDIMIVHGLHPLYTPELRALSHVHIYLDPEPTLLQQWKVMRDSTSRGYTVRQVRQEIMARRRDSKLYIQPQKQYADIVVRFSRGSLYYRTGDPAHLDVRLIESKDAPKIDLSEVLETWKNGNRPTLRLIEESYDGILRDVLEIDGQISHQKACELEDCIWAHMLEVSHLRPERLNQLGRFYVGSLLRQSDPLALTQLIILYHVVNARALLADEEYLLDLQ